LTQVSFGGGRLVPWTQRFRIDWRPEVRFLETRVELLRQLENKGQLKSFKIDETEITARLAAYAEMTIAVNHLELRVLSPLQPVEVCLDAAKTAVELIRPASIRGRGANIAYVSEITGDYDELRRTIGLHLFRWWPAVLTDWALLVDGAGQNGATYQCEFGVVAATEIADRLSRRSGRTGGPPISLARLGLDRQKLPSVAVFADFDWADVAEVRPGALAWDDFSAFIASTSSESTEIALGLQRVVTETTSKPAEMGAS
jgi:hypothetical protein